MGRAYKNSNKQVHGVTITEHQRIRSKRKLKMSLK